MGPTGISANPFMPCFFGTSAGILNSCDAKEVILLFACKDLFFQRKGICFRTRDSSLTRRRNPLFLSLDPHFLLKEEGMWRKVSPLKRRVLYQVSRNPESSCNIFTCSLGHAKTFLTRKGFALSYRPKLTDALLVRQFLLSNVIGQEYKHLSPANIAPLGRI